MIEHEILFNKDDLMTLVNKNEQKRANLTLVSYLPLETLRLKILNIDPKYQKDIFKEFTPEVAKYMLLQPYKSLAEVSKFIKDSLLENVAGTNLQTVVTDKNDNFVGLAALYKINTKEPRFGIWLKLSSQGQGYGKEIVSALKSFSDKYVDYDFLIYPADKDNIGSRKIAESLGGEICAKYTFENMAKQKLDIVEYRFFSK